MPTERTTDADTPKKEQVKTEDSQQGGEDYEKKYKELQAEFTRKSQKLAELEKQSQQSSTKANSNADEEEQLKNWLKTNGFVSKDELEATHKKTIQETEFNDLLRYYPELKKNENAIRDLAESTWKSYEEIALDYNFTSSDKLQKAKESRNKMLWNGNPVKNSKPKSLRDASIEEYEQWKQEQGIGSASKFIRK